jgi:hypothetical protein
MELPKNQFNNVIRVLKTAPIDRVRQIRTMTFKTLKRLEVERDFTYGIIKTPKGSDQVDVGAIVTWLNKIQPGEEAAIKQLLSIDATACKRINE